MSLAEALTELDELARRLRRECPWDREQTAKTIVPHTVEEAYEVADAALAGDDAKLLDEIGDLLFQAYFLALLLEERGTGDLEPAARGVHAKLVARHPHVFGEVEAETAGRVRQNWERIKREQEGRDGRLPRRARVAAGAAARRGRCSGARRPSGSSIPTSPARSPTSRTSSRELRAELPRPIRRRDEPRPRVAAELGDVLFACVNVARRVNVDPELELRAATRRFRDRVEAAERLAAADGKDWVELAARRAGPLLRSSQGDGVDDEQDRGRCTGGRCSTRAGIPRSRWMWCSRPARSGGRSCRRARRRAVHEAVELRDGGAEWGGKGVTQAVANVNGEIADAVRGLDASRPGRRSTAR